MSNNFKFYEIRTFVSDPKEHTVGRDFFALDASEANSKPYYVGIRYCGNTTYITEEIKPSKKERREISADEIPAKVLAAMSRHFGILILSNLTEQQLKAEKEKIILPKDDSNLIDGEFYTFTQICLMCDGYDGIEPIRVSSADYHIVNIKNEITKSSTHLFSKVDNRFFFKECKMLVPWCETKYKTEKNYLRQRYLPKLEDIKGKNIIPVGNEVFNQLLPTGNVVYNYDNLKKTRNFLKDNQRKTLGYDIFVQNIDTLEYLGIYIFEYTSPTEWSGFGGTFKFINDAEDFLKKIRHEISQRIRFKKEPDSFKDLCTQISKELNIPFEICWAFKGDKNSLKAFKKSLGKAIQSVVDYDVYKLSVNSRSLNRAEMCRLGIDISFVDANKINTYVLNCLDSGHIL